MISLKNIIILILIFIFLYLIAEYFYNQSPKIIESFNLGQNSNSNSSSLLGNIPSQFDIKITKDSSLKNLETQINNIKKKQNENQRTINYLNSKITGSK